jgi:riboflavin biosynthesis pyrimidine reductase
LARKVYQAYWLKGGKPIRILQQNLVDEIMLFVSPKVFGKGISAFNLNLDLSKYIRSVQKVGSDVLYQFQLREY